MKVEEKTKSAKAAARSTKSAKSSKSEKSEKSEKAEGKTSVAQGATRAAPAEDLDPGRERRPLESYFQEIGGTRTLKREEEVILAKELEAATAAAPRGALRHPALRAPRRGSAGTSCARCRTPARSSRSRSGDEETGEIAARVERAVKRLRTLLNASATSARKRRREGASRRSTRASPAR